MENGVYLPSETRRLLRLFRCAFVETGGYSAGSPDVKNSNMIRDETTAVFWPHAGDWRRTLRGLGSYNLGVDSIQIMDTDWPWSNFRQRTTRLSDR